MELVDLIEKALSLVRRYPLCKVRVKCQPKTESRYSLEEVCFRNIKPSEDGSSEAKSSELDLIAMSAGWLMAGIA